MKKISFFVCVFILFFCKVNASEVYLYDINEGDKFLYGDKVDVFLGNHYGTTFPAQVMLFYVDKNDNLLEAFTVNNVWYFTWSGTEEYSRDMYLDSYYDFAFGKSCLEVYSAYEEFEEYGESYKEACDKYFTLYSSGKNLNDIDVWNLEIFDYVNNDFLSDVCESNKDFESSYICENPGYFDYGHYFVLKEYVPVSFKLVCEPKVVKKGETSSCDLVINADTEVKEITVPMTSELFDVDKYTEIDGWTLVKNDDGTVTITSKEGFSGEGVVLGATVTFKEDLLDDVDIELNDIHYTTSDGLELNGSAKDSVTIYEEPEESEVKEEQQENPNTIDFVPIISLIVLSISFVVLCFYKNKTKDVI